MQQESMDSIIVLLRIRPFNEKEKQEEAQPCFKIDDHSKNTVIFEGSSKGEARYFTFDHVCPQQIHQEEIFRIVGIPTARSCLQGYNGCIFAYGQTGAGKTYTIQGRGLDIDSLRLDAKEEVGLLPRVVEYMFSDIASAHDTSSNIVYSVKCSFLEIYNEHIIDLLNPTVKNLQVREDLKRGVHVEGITEEICSNALQTMDILTKGNRNRHIGSTNLNIESSRSHSVFTFTVEGKITQDGITRIRSSQFSFVDLAGSERQKVVGTAGERLKEGCLINKSLMVLASVINSLVDISEGKSRFVHYRDSKLTFLLKYSLGGNAKTSVIANISPASTSYMETLSTLKFAQRAKLIKNKVRINEDTSGTLESLKNEIFRLRQELATIKSINIGGIKHDDYKRDPNRVGFESDQGSDTYSNRFHYESVDNQELREAQKNSELERLLRQSMDILKESETHLLGELSKKEDMIGKLENAYEAAGKNECQMKLVIKLLYDKVERYKAMLAKKMITKSDCLDIIEEEQKTELQKKVVQVLKEPQTDLQKEQMKELTETRDENIRIKQEYKRLLELLGQKDTEIARLVTDNENLVANASKGPVIKESKKGGSAKGPGEKWAKETEGRIKEEYDELVKEYMNLCDKLEEREQDVDQMRQDFMNLEAEKKEMTENLSKELEQIKKDYYKKLEKIVKEKERRMDQMRDEFVRINNEKEKLQETVSFLTQENSNFKQIEEAVLTENETLTKKLDELKARVNQSNQDKLSSMSRFEESKQKEQERFSAEVSDLQEKLKRVIEENKAVKNENRKIVEEYESACKEIKADYERIKEEGRMASDQLQEMQGLYEDLQQQYAEKDEENQALLDEVEKLRKELDTKNQLIPTLKDNYNGIAKEFSQKTMEVENVRDEFEKLKEAKVTSEQEYKKLQKEHDRLTCQHTYLKQEEAALREELKIVQHKLDCEIQETRHIKSEYDKLTSSLKNKEQEFQGVKSDHGGLQKKLKEKDQEIEGVKSDYENLRRDNQAKEREIQDLKRLYDAIKKDSLNKTQEIQTIQQEYDKSQRNLSEKLQEIQMIKNSMDESKQKTLDSHQQELGRIRNNYNALEENYFTKEREVENLKGEIEDLRSQRSQDSHRIEDLTREIKGLQQKLFKGADELRSLKEECEIYRNQKSGINQELSALAKQYQEMRNENDAKQQEIDNLQEQILKLREKCIVVQEKCDALTRDCQDWEAKYGLKEEDFARLKIEAENLRRSVMEQDDNYENMRREFEVLQSEARKNKNVYESLREENEKAIVEFEKISGLKGQQEKEMNELKKECNRLKIERKRLMAEVEEYQQEEAKLKDQVDSRLKDISELEGLITRQYSPEKDKRRANIGTKRIIRQLDSVLEELAVKDRRIRGMEEKIMSLTEEVAEKAEELKIKEMLLRDKDDKISAQAKELMIRDEDALIREQERIQLKEDYRLLLDEKSLFDKAEESLRDEVLRLSEELIKTRDRKNEAKAEMKKIHKELEQENNRLISLLNRKEEELVTLKGKCTRLEEEVEALNVSRAEWMEKANISQLEELNQENYNQLREQYIKISEKYEQAERELLAKDEEISQLKQDCNTLIDERDQLHKKVENYKTIESKLKKEIQEHANNLTRLHENQEKEIKEIKEHYSHLNSDHKNYVRGMDSKDSQVLKLKEELQIILSEKERLMEEVKSYKPMSKGDTYRAYDNRSKSKNERDSYTSRMDEVSQEGLYDRHYSGQKGRYVREEESDSRNVSGIGLYDKVQNSSERADRFSRKPDEYAEKEKPYFRGSYSNQKEPEYFRIESGKKNADNSGILKAFPRGSVTDFLTPQKDRSSLNASRDIENSFSGLGKNRGTYSRERENDIESSIIQNSIMEKEALLLKQKIYLGQPISSCFMEGENERRRSQHSIYDSKSKSLLPTPTKNSGNNESFYKYSDSKLNNMSKSPNLRRVDQNAEDSLIRESTLDSYRRSPYISAKSSPNKLA